MSGDLLDYLPPAGKSAKAAQELNDRFQKLKAADQQRLSLPVESAKLRVPVPEPKKVILLAGNYAAHITEGGGQAPERLETFPYFFWKPPSTTLTHPGDPVRVPAVSPKHVDWEVELGVIMGKRCRDVSEKDALQYVAGYSVCNDISDRKFQINPGRKKRDKDSFFDWLHGKWHDTFLPMGPCVLSAAGVDPQKLPLKLKVNGQVMQDASTAQMIFPVAAIVSILSTFTTLEPGDIISTGTPSGVGHARKPPVYLKAGDVVEAEIAGIGVLRNPVV
jgi:2-keto-4-pentenoate hydratase/2-oxohepta-3-ene-1,7-dioic acid hydratase in catechol pathway